MKIQQLTESDLDSFITIRHSALEKSPDAFLTTLEESQSKPITQINLSEKSIIIGAFEEDRIIGMVGMIRKTKTKEIHVVELWGVFVEPELRGHGIGQALMDETISTIKKMDGVEQVRAAVVTTQIAATQLYKNCGFESQWIQPKAFKSEATYFDLDHMVLNLV